MVNAREKVLEYIDAHKDDIVAFLRKLISYPSVTGSELEIQNFISEWLRTNLGAQVDVWEPDIEVLKQHPAFVASTASYKGRPNVVGVCKGAGGGRSLVYNGHVDVIPAGPEEAWNQNPWNAPIQSGRIYGRGSSDMKGGLAAYSMAMWAIVRSSVRLKGDVTLEYVVDEELSGNGTLAAMLRGYVADAGISAETSSLRVQPASIGRIWFEIEVRGKPAGIQRRWEGVNAIDEAYKIKCSVDEFEKVRLSKVSHPLYPDIRETIPCMVGMFQAGSYPSAFPDTCVLKGSIATVPGEDSDQVKKAFVQHIESTASSDPWMRNTPPRVRFTGYFAEPSELPVNHPVVQTLVNDFKEVAGRDPVISGRVGAADIRFYNKYGKTPMVIFGPGLTEQMHATNEYVEIDGLIEATKVMALATLDWCGYE